jgi:hypothetical protein
MPFAMISCVVGNRSNAADSNYEVIYIYIYITPRLRWQWWRCCRSRAVYHPWKASMHVQSFLNSERSSE